MTDDDSRPARLARRDQLIRELAARFFGDIPACARPPAISFALDREAVLLTRPSTPRRVLLRQVLESNGGAGLSRVQVRNVLLWTRTPPRRLLLAIDNAPPNRRVQDEQSSDGAHERGGENAEAWQVVRRR